MFIINGTNPKLEYDIEYVWNVRHGKRMSTHMCDLSVKLCLLSCDVKRTNRINVSNSLYFAKIKILNY